MICSVVAPFFVSWDITLLRFFNTTLANPLFDAVMPVITSIDFWRIPIILALAGIAIFGGRYGLTTVLVGIVLLTIADQLSSSVLKDLFGRLRPCHEIEGIRVLTGCGNSKAFPSSHAVNTMAAAIFFGARYRKIRWELIGLSVLISYSRVYIGIHYPGDILAGWLLGGGVAFGVLAAYRPLADKWPQIENTKKTEWILRLLRRKKHE